MYHPTHGSNSLQFVPITYFPLFCTITICLVLSPVEWPIRKDLGGFAAQCFQWSEGWQEATLLQSGQYATVPHSLHSIISTSLRRLKTWPEFQLPFIIILIFSSDHQLMVVELLNSIVNLCSYVNKLCGFASKRNSNEVRIHFMFTLMHELFYIVLKHNFHLLTMNFRETNA